MTFEEWWTTYGPDNGRGLDLDTVKEMCEKAFETGFKEGWAEMQDV